MSGEGTRIRAAADVVALARRSLVGVRSGAAAGTGWVALGNGLVMTSHDAVGYEPTVELEAADGQRSRGRVIWVDVARDLAMILPAERLSLPPLLARPDLPRLGEPVLALAAVPDAQCRVVSAVVSAIDVRVGALRCLELDRAVGSSGGPIVDLDGRVIGVGGLDLPRGARRRGAAPAPESGSLAIPVAALSRALATADVAREQFEGRSPTYRCPACNEPFDGGEDRCAACGRLLPHGWEPADVSRGAATADAERLLHDLLAELGVRPAPLRVGPRAFRFSCPTPRGTNAEVVLTADEDGATIRGKLALLRIPTANHEPFYRCLLTLNDQALDTHRFSVEGDTVYLSFVEPTALVRPGEGAARVRELVREAERYRKALGEPFEAAPIG